MVPESEGDGRARLWKRSDDLPELVLGECPERFRGDVPERGCGQREFGDDVVAWCLGDEDEVVSTQREIHALERPACLLRRVPEVIDTARTVFDLGNALRRVTSERDECGHGVLPFLLRPPPLTAQSCARSGKPGALRD